MLTAYLELVLECRIFTSFWLFERTTYIWWKKLLWCSSLLCLEVWSSHSLNVYLSGALVLILSFLVHFNAHLFLRFVLLANSTLSEMFRHLNFWKNFVPSFPEKYWEKKVLGSWLLGYVGLNSQLPSPSKKESIVFFRPRAFFIQLFGCLKDSVWLTVNYWLTVGTASIFWLVGKMTWFKCGVW